MVSRVRQEESKRVWSERRLKHLQSLAGTVGKSPGEAVIESMGATSPPLVEEPRVILDYIVSDGAQVTRPSIDPYREPIETHIHLFLGRVRLSMPFIARIDGLGESLGRAVLRASYNLGVLVCYGGSDLELLEGYEETVLIDVDSASRMGKEEARRYAGLVVGYRGWDRVRFTIAFGRVLGIPIILHHPTSRNLNQIIHAAVSGISGILLDEDLGESDEDLEVSLSEADTLLKEKGLRNKVSIIASSRRVRGADDVFKLMGLGADAVCFRDMIQVAVGEGDLETLQERVECLYLGLQKEIKLLAGAAGVSCLYTTLIGNRELFRAINLEPSIRRRLRIKPAGVG